MTDDLLDQVRAALEAWDKYEAWDHAGSTAPEPTEDERDLCENFVPGDSDQLVVWLRALLARVEKAERRPTLAEWQAGIHEREILRDKLEWAEARVRELHVIINNMEPRR